METVNIMAQRLAEMFSTAVIEQQKAGAGTPHIAHIENGMREALKQIGQQALGLFLSAMQTTPASQIDCPCGGKLQCQRMRTAQAISDFRRVTYERAYYAGCQCKQGKAPLDEQFGLEPGAVTAWLAALLALAGIEFSFDQSAQWLQTYLLFDMAENTVRSETEKMGGLQKEWEAELIQQCQDEADLQERERHPGRIPRRIYGAIDAAKVRIETRAKGGEQPEKQKAWRDMKVLSWSETEAVPPAQRPVRQRKQAEGEHLALRAKNLCYFCDIIEADEFGKLLWATGCSLKADLSPEVVFLGDGAVWMPSLLPTPRSGPAGWKKSPRSFGKARWKR